MAKIWTEENEEYIRQHYRERTYAELAEHFHVTQKAMESKIRRMGLKKQDSLSVDAEMALFFPPQEPEPVDTGPAPISSFGTLRHATPPEETAEDREARLQDELAAAETEKARREEMRSDKLTKQAIKLLEQGVKLYHEGSLAKAARAFEKVLGAGDLGLKQRASQYLRACERRRRPAVFKPQGPEEHYLLGVIQLNNGDPAGALRAFDAALSQAPGDDRVLYCQAAAHAQSGAIDEAISALREAIGINESNRVYALNDPDFVSLHVHDDFRGLTAGDE